MKTIFTILVFISICACGQRSRPQDPLSPFPYEVEEVEFRNKIDGAELSGTLTIPQDGETFPAVILVSGSGLQDRDETVYGHKPFKVIADYLCRNGIAVLRYDDRGVGGSGGSAAGATTEDLATDARAAVDYLITRGDIDPARVGIIGHSEGGLIAFMLASSQKNIAYLVSLAGPGVDGKTIMLDQSEHIARLSGTADSILQGYRTFLDEIYALSWLSLMSIGIISFEIDFPSDSVK